MSSPVTGSLFAPFFFPLGIAFMGAQSAVMMKMAGENWQYGKRRISAMSNEDFNKLTPVKLYQIETAELQAIIPSITQSLESMTPLTATIVTEMINTFKVGAQATLSYLNDIADTPIGKVIMFAIKVWMPWMEPLLGEHVSDIITIKQPPIIQAPKIPIPSIPKTPKIIKTIPQITQQKQQLIKHIDKNTSDKLMKQFTTFLAKISSHNQSIKTITQQLSTTQYKNNAAKKAQLKKFILLKQSVVKFFEAFKKNNKGWLSANNLS